LLTSLFFASLYGSGCAGRVTVTNDTSTTIIRLEVDADGRLFSLRDLRPGDRQSFSFAPSRDGCFKVSGRFSTGALIGPACVGYFTNGQFWGNRLVVKPGGVVREE